MDISFELYKVFYYVATTLSFSEASRQLYISQSAVSQSIKALEQKLGHALFLRNKKKVTLTPEGESLLRHVEPAVNLLFEGENQILNSPSLEAPLRIGASDTICRYFLIPYFKRFHREFPNVHIKVTNSTSGGVRFPSSQQPGGFYCCQCPQSLPDLQGYLLYHSGISGYLCSRQTLLSSGGAVPFPGTAYPVSDSDVG